MSSQKKKVGDKEVDKKTFYSSKEAILLDSVDLSKIVVSSRWKLNDTTYKYFCGMDILNILMMVEKICRLLRMMNKFMRIMMKYGM